MNICTCQNDPVKICTWRALLLLGNNQQQSCLSKYMYKFSSFDWDHFPINFSACLFSLLPKRFCFEVTECCVCYCNIITSVPFSGLTCWVISAFILSPHRHASEMSSNSSLGEMPTQQAVVQSFLKNYDKVCSLWYMKENECSIYISITCICNDTLNVEIFAWWRYLQRLHIYTQAPNRKAVCWKKDYGISCIIS